MSFFLSPQHSRHLQVIISLLFDSPFQSFLARLGAKRWKRFSRLLQCTCREDSFNLPPVVLSRVLTTLEREGKFSSRLLYCFNFPLHFPQSSGLAVLLVSFIALYMITFSSSINSGTCFLKIYKQRNEKDGRIKTWINLLKENFSQNIKQLTLHIYKLPNMKISFVLHYATS